MDSAATDDGRRSSNGRRYTTISIPQPLYQEIKNAIEGTGFRSPTEFMVYVTRLSLQGPLVRGEHAHAGPASALGRHGSPLLGR